MGENEKKVHDELERIRKVNPDYFKGSSNDVIIDGKKHIEIKPSQFFIDVITAASKDAKQGN